MCGIGGQFKAKNSHFFDPQSWISKLRLRGPDANGTFQNNQFQVVHTRLSILDPSDQAHQPMVWKTDTEHIVLAFNGEIYNYQEIRKRLEALGYPFHSRGDTEVVLKAYHHFGLDFVHELNGMYAISIWDGRFNKLHLIRDPMGIKPMFYTCQKNSFYFSSLIDPLLDTLECKKLNPNAINSYLKFRYNIMDETFFQGIQKLTPGTILTINSDLTTSERQFWQPPKSGPSIPVSFNEASDKFYDLLEDSVRLRSHSHTKMATFLSGGIDSSAITALASRYRSDLQAFTMNTRGGYDESPFAKELCTSLGIEHNSLAVDSNDFNYYDAANKALEEPLGDSIIVPTWKLAQTAVKSAKTVLTGEGADEILGGYVHHLAMAQAQLLAQMFPWLTSKEASRLLLWIPQGVWERFFPYPHKLGKTGVKRFVNFLGYLDSPAQAFVRLLELIPNDNDLIVKSWRDKIPLNLKADSVLSNYWNDLDHFDFLNNLICLDLRFWNPSYTLTRLDRLTMDHSLEARVPFLDHRLVSFCLKLPQSYKSQFLDQKRILRRALSRSNLLPQQIIQRKKQPFFLPIEKAFPKEFQKIMNKQLKESSQDFFEFIDPQQLRWLLDDDHESGLLRHKNLFNLYILSLFLKIHS